MPQLKLKSTNLNWADPKVTGGSAKELANTARTISSQVKKEEKFFSASAVLSFVEDKK